MTTKPECCPVCGETNTKDGYPFEIIFVCDQVFVLEGDSWRRGKVFGGTCERAFDTAVKLRAELSDSRAQSERLYERGVKDSTELATLRAQIAPQQAVVDAALAWCKTHDTKKIDFIALTEADYELRDAVEKYMAAPPPAFVPTGETK